MKHPQIIESPSNQKIKEVVSIRDEKETSDLWFAEGLRIIQAAGNSPAEIKELFVTDEFLRKELSLEKLTAPSRPVITRISGRVAKKLSGTETPQGIFGIVRFRKKRIREIEPAPHEMIPVLDRIQDPGNVGAIIRTADAFGTKNIVLLEGTCSPSNQKVIRASAGSVFHMNLVTAPAGEFIQWARDKKVSIIVADAQAKKTLDEMLPARTEAVVFGNEASGASAFLKKAADDMFRIPIPGGAESLNVAITAAIVLYASIVSKGDQGKRRAIS